MDTHITLNYKPEPLPADHESLNLSVTGLHGGHSGDEIHKGYGNSVKIMTRLLSSLSVQYDAMVSNFDGGNLRNAIPREAFATISFNPFFSIEIGKSVAEFFKIMKDEFGPLEPELMISARSASKPGFIMDRESQNKLLSALTACPHGVVGWSKEMDNLVETSSNLASVKFIDGNSVRVITTQRSSIESAKHDISSTVEACFRLAGADVQMTDGYPGWKPNITSEILKITRQSYLRLFGKEPLVRAIHAGLECGLIYEKDRNMDMISFGPTIKGAHTPEEMISIDSVNKFWDLLLDVIKNIPDNPDWTAS
jgi:dipeptidase D